MAVKLRCKDIVPHDYLNPDAQINVMIEAFDDVNGRIYSRGNLAYSGGALGKMTQAEVRARVRDDALAWASEQKAAITASSDAAKNVTLIGRLSTLIGAEIDVP
jgi:hypothetical protein